MSVATSAFVPPAGVPSMKLDRLEALRGLSALYVVFHHVVPHTLRVADLPVGFLFRFGQEAVILFFLLSGFVIHYSFGRGSDRTFRGYFVKRAVRIYVPLIVVLLTSYAVVCLTAGEWVDPEPLTFVGNLAMLQDWSFARPNVIVEAYMGNGPLWSLAYEWWFYMLYWPIQHWLRDARSRDRIVLGGAVCASALYVFWPTPLPRVLAYFGIWWVGVMLADVYVRRRLDDWRVYVRPVGALALMAVILGAGALSHWQTDMPLLFGRHPLVEVRHFGFAALAVAAAASWHRARWVGFDRMTAPFLVVAPISYTLYISHVILLVDADYLRLLGNPMLEQTAYLFVTVAFCWAVELKLYPGVRRRLVGRKGAPRGVSGGVSRGAAGGGRSIGS